LARFSAAAVRLVQPAQQLAGSGASAQPAGARQPEAQDAAALPEAAVAPDAAAGQQRAARGAAAVRRLAVQDAAAGLQQAAQDAEVVQRRAVQDAAALQPEAPGGPAVELPSAAAWVFRRDQVLPWPEPQPVARFARATACLRIAARSERWWQAATNEVLS
jgi:hypothetical protein